MNGLSSRSAGTQKIVDLSYSENLIRMGLGFLMKTRHQDMANLRQDQISGVFITRQKSVSKTFAQWHN